MDKTKFKQYIIYFFSTSMVHGFSHLVDNKTYILQKLIWLFLVLMAFAGAWTLSVLTVYRYIENPIVISVERDKFSWKTYLPGNTVCLRRLFFFTNSGNLKEIFFDEINWANPDFFVKRHLFTIATINKLHSEKSVLILLPTFTSHLAYCIPIAFYVWAAKKKQYVLAITLCPITKLNEEALDEYVANFPTKNKEDLKDFIISLANANFTSLHTVLNNTDLKPDQYMPVLYKLKFTFNPTISTSGLTTDMQMTLQDSVTEMGICYSFQSQLAVYNSFM